MSRKKNKDNEQEKLIIAPENSIVQETEMAMAQVLANKNHRGKILFVDPDTKDYDLSIKRLDTNILSLNKILSDKYYGPGAGFAMGRIYNFFGPESIGKSALAAQLSKVVLDAGGQVCWLDKEDSFDPEYFNSAYGIDWYTLSKNRRFILSKPDTAEAAFDIIQAFVDNEMHGLIVLDSVPSLATASDMEGDASTNSMASVARRMATHFQRITGKLSRINTSIIYINQLRVNLSGGMAYGEKSTGGNAMKFYSHVSLRFRKLDYITRGEGLKSEFIGTDVLIEAEKNKTAWPHLKANIPLYPGEGFSAEADLINLALKTGVVSQSGAWYSFNDKKIGQGFENTRIILKNDPDLYLAIKSATLEKLVT